LKVALNTTTPSLKDTKEFMLSGKKKKWSDFWIVVGYDMLFQNMMCYFREKLDILIDEDELRDENIENIPKEACNMSGYSLLSDRERKVNYLVD